MLGTLIRLRGVSRVPAEVGAYVVAMLQALGGHGDDSELWDLQPGNGSQFLVKDDKVTPAP